MNESKLQVNARDEKDVMDDIDQLGESERLGRDGGENERDIGFENRASDEDVQLSFEETRLNKLRRNGSVKALKNEFSDVGCNTSGGERELGNDTITSTGRCKRR